MKPESNDASALLEPELHTVTVDGLTIQYREVGSGPVVLLVHGWPTSSYLWRRVMPYLGVHCRTVAIDLPGFGGSDKPLDRVYDAASYRPVLEGFCDALGIGSTLSLAVHDLGGPVALHWAMNSERRIKRLAILNTLIYPELSLMVRAFFGACQTPGLANLLATPWALRQTLRFGMSRPGRAEKAALHAIGAPFADGPSRKVLIKTITDFDPLVLPDIATWVSSLEIPVQIVRGAKDRILPEMGHTARRLQAALPQANLHTFVDCGHFLQEERPDELGLLLADFFAQESLSQR